MENFSPLLEKIFMIQPAYQEYHQNLPEQTRKWLNAREISDEIINRYFIGWDKDKITIPIFDENGNWLFFKYRKDPDDKNETKPKYWYSLKGMAVLYGVENLKGNPSQIIICEGELDRLTLESKGFKAITSTGGIGTFKEEWAKYFKDIPEVYICFDRDEAGRKGAERVAKLIPHARVIMLPEMGNEKKDITDYFIQSNSGEDFKELMKKAKTLNEITKEIEETTLKIKRSVGSFPPLSIEELNNILGLTLKRDDINKVITFLCMSSAYTEESQFNVSFIARSSTGKSYIPLEIASLFPEEDVIEIGYSSPTAFYHDYGKFIPEIKGYKMDLERKILIFIDQPHTHLLQRLRPLLSHDKKIIPLKITDRKERHGLRTKNILLTGYPSVIFCTGNLKIEEQEKTRLILLSPEITEEKLKESIEEKIKRNTDKETYYADIKASRERRELIKRIRAIKEMKVREIIVPYREYINQKFISLHKRLKPRHQRDIGHLISLIKVLALLNLWHRDFRGNSIIANKEDIEKGFEIWGKVAESQELSLPPYLLDLYRNVLLPLWEEKKEDDPETKGLERAEIIKKYYQVYGEPLPDWQLRQEIIPMWESTGLIIQDFDLIDKRKRLIRPVSF